MSVSCVLEGLREEVQAPGTIRAWCSLSIVVSGYDRSVNGSQLHDAFRRFQSPVKKNIFYELFSKKYKQVSWVRASCWCLAVCIPAIFKGRRAEFKRHACEQQPLMSASPAEFSSPAEYRLGHGKHQTAAILSDGAELRAHDSVSDNKNPPLPCGASVKPGSTFCESGIVTTRGPPTNLWGHDDSTQKLGSYIGVGFSSRTSSC